MMGSAPATLPSSGPKCAAEQRRRRVTPSNRDEHHVDRAVELAHGPQRRRAEVVVAAVAVTTDCLRRTQRNLRNSTSNLRNSTSRKISVASAQIRHPAQLSR